jgi:tetratricopeptide (TPR) repeat protein
MGSLTRNVGVVLGTAALLVSPLRADHDHDHDHATESLGKVHFPVSCQPAQQPAFDRAVALVHSFGYERAENAFNEILAQDPKCAMAYWGIAMSTFHQIWGPATDAEFARGRAAAQKAAQFAPPSPREGDLMRAIGAFYLEEKPRNHPERVAAYADAMTSVAARYPDDHEIQIFRALSLLAKAYNSPPDKTYAVQKQAAGILNALLPLEPQHPGIAHYMIHSFDYPELAPLALDAARAYAKIAPDAPHALHMPSHIFTRLGYWQESIDSNLASAAAATKQVEQEHPGATSFNALHAMDYLEYAYLQTARDTEAKGVVDGVAGATSVDAPEPAGGYAIAAVPARYALERRSWKEAAALTLSPAFPWEKFPQTEAIVHFARAVGAARGGDVATARQALDRLTALQSALQGQKGFDWATQVEIQRRAAAGWLARAEKRDGEALTLLRSAADLEDSTDKHPVTPGAVLPAREQLADLLVELGQPKEALAEYERSLHTAPARYNSLLGAAQAAEKSGESVKATDLYGQLAALCKGSTSERARLAESRLRVATK